jgi:hypothetical protein
VRRYHIRRPCRCAASQQLKLFQLVPRPQRWRSYRPKFCVHCSRSVLGLNGNLNELGHITSSYISNSICCTDVISYLPYLFGFFSLRIFLFIGLLYPHIWQLCLAEQFSPPQKADYFLFPHLYDDARSWVGSYRHRFRHVCRSALCEHRLVCLQEFWWELELAFEERWISDSIFPLSYYISLCGLV